MDRRVVITGIGGLCGVGTNAASIWKEMREGRCSIGPVTNAELYDVKLKIGAEIKALPEHDIDRKHFISMDRFSLLAVLAAREASAMLGFPPMKQIVIVSVRLWASAAAAGTPLRIPCAPFGGRSPCWHLQRT